MYRRITSVLRSPLAVVGGDLVAQRVDEVGHRPPVVAEGRQVQGANTCLVLPPLHTNVHKRTVERSRVPVDDRPAGQGGHEVYHRDNK